MNILSTILCSLVLMLSSFIASADSLDQEVQYLLETIENSDCIFIRNGTMYSPQEARAHILRKYNYIKSKISTTEQAIKYAATESSWSGKPYQIKCPGKEALPSGQWLTDKLISYRAQD